MGQEINFADVSSDIAASSPARPRVDPARLQRFLVSQPDVRALQLGELRYIEDAGGSNGIALFDAVINGDRQSFVLRYAPGEQLLQQKRFDEEFQTLSAVRAAGVPAPKGRWCDPTGQSIGYPFLVMDKVEGRAPANRMMYANGLLAEVGTEERKSMLLEAAGFHGRLRKAAIGPSAVPHLTGRGVGATAIERELSWWMEEVKLATAPGDPRRDYLTELTQWMILHQPQARPETLVHGDAQIANLMFHQGHFAAALDWELSYLGHTEADLALVVMLIPAHVPQGVWVTGLPSEAELIARYESEAGAPVEHWDYFKLFNLVKVSAIMLMTSRHMSADMAQMMWGLNASDRALAWDRARAAAL
ncbi:MAG TPA: phosphotransferase family protein [Caulobacteraceae bacterium]|jgi:aminoglycoside phosphotransferase (APT) family kinase protein